VRGALAQQSHTSYVTDQAVLPTRNADNVVDDLVRDRAASEPSEASHAGRTLGSGGHAQSVSDSSTSVLHSQEDCPWTTLT
jgi:hypothetical protein